MLNDPVPVSELEERSRRIAEALKRSLAGQLRRYEYFQAVQEFVDYMDNLSTRPVEV